MNASDRAKYDNRPSIEYLADLRARMRYAAEQSVIAEKARAEERARLERRYPERLTMLAAKRDDLEYGARVATLIGWQKESIRLALQLQAELEYMKVMNDAFGSIYDVEEEEDVPHATDNPD